MKYDLEINLMDYDIVRTDENGWRNAGVLVAEGDCLRDLMKDASVFWYDKDGAELYDQSLSDVACYDFQIYGELVWHLMQEVEDV